MLKLIFVYLLGFFGGISLPTKEYDWTAWIVMIHVITLIAAIGAVISRL